MAVISGKLPYELLGFIFVIFAGFYIYIRYFVFNYWRKKGVVYIKPTFPTGNFGSVVRQKLSMGELFRNAYAEHKSNRYFGMYMFHKPNLIIVDPDLLRYVFIKKFDHFHDRGFYFNEKVDPLTGHLFLLSGSKWRNIRAKLTPTYTSGNLKKMFVTITDCGIRLAQHLKPIAEKCEVIDAKDLFARFGTDVIMSTAFGINCNSIDNPNSEFRYWGQRALKPKMIRGLLMVLAPKIMDIFSIPYNPPDVTNFFTNIFKETLEYRKVNDITRPDFMHLLMQLMSRGYVDDDNDDDSLSITDITSGKMTLMEAVAQAFVFFEAGFETTSTTITFCLYELSLNQDIQDKVLKDINASLEKFGGLTYEGLQEMIYLNKVVSETLRKYPPVPLLNRQCTKDIQLPETELYVSKGTDIIIPVLGIHRDPDIYPNPDTFDPERFNEENISSRHPYTYLPFGEGPRLCIGMRFGLAQTKVGLISILSKYRVRLGPNTRVPLDIDPTCFILTVKGVVELLVEAR